MEDFYQEIIAYWEKNKRNIPWDRNDYHSWTNWIKDSFCDLAEDEKKAKGEEIAVELSKTKKRGEGEYLVDVCWWKEQGGKYWLELALESEWIDTEDEIDTDFFKLIDIKAVRKVWVCSYGKKLYRKRRLKILKSVRSARFTFEEEKYLIINIPDSEKQSESNQLRIQGFWIDAKGKASKPMVSLIKKAD
ncbi:MAG: hypothetical protein Q8Q08_08495 [Candidatus Omnitrophota bacterium]|nr:hypothetical protein [Candidatus Omnitrophota bacterium]MDZ4242377.1 hypothetical protein [Candidatus Omnitrophota bacterium]